MSVMTYATTIQLDKEYLVAFSNTLTTQTQTTYTEELVELLKEFENTKEDVQTAHFEGKSIAIGYGYDLIQNVSTIKNDLLSYIKKEGESDVDALKRLDDVVNLIKEYNKIREKVSEHKYKYENPLSI